MIPSALAERAATDPDGTCLIDAETGERIGYGDLHVDSLRVAAQLETLGVRRGDRVATMLAHSVDTYRVWFGLARLGAVEVPIGTRHRGQMLRHVLADSGARLLVVDLDRLPELRPVLAELPSEVALVAPAALLGGPTAAPGDVGVPPGVQDVSLVLYTSGTTGPAKGVLVPWGQVHATSAGAFPAGTLGPGKVVYAPFPPHHVGGRLFGCLGILEGVPTVVRHTFSVRSFWPDVDRHRCTTVGVVSAMASMLLGAPARPDDGAHALEEVLMVPLVPQLREFERRFGVRVCTSFNMTEVSIPIVSEWSPDDWRSCGKVRTGPPGYELRVVDDDDVPVRTGGVGELVCRTEVPWAMNAGYLGRPEATAYAWRNGWFHTGDAFRRSEDGSYQFVDRAKDAIRRRGENISSFEVEREVLDHPEVEACAAIGVPAELGEEEVKVFVVARRGSGLTEADVVAHVAAKAASFMVPAYVEFLDELPVTEGTGRVRKSELRDRERRGRSAR